MKTPYLFILILLAAVISCGTSPIPEFYDIQFPPLPASWTELLGKNHWRLEYYDSGGSLCYKEISDSTGIKINVLQEWPNAILAWPYWPEKALPASYFNPAGGLFPLDVRGQSIILSWEAGAEAYFYRELDKIENTGTNRNPKYFDWKRFRSLLRENTAIAEDPWLADWKSIAERTVRSGFRQSYVRAETRTATEITIPHSGPWIFASPFKPPRFWTMNETIILSLSVRPEVLVCPGGRFTISSAMELWMPFQ